ncbi:hypothetical protein MIMGU_mgv1a020965mg [Erythranthe guttata]|uniref:Carotenoid cleavage dioxygenase 4 n=1 Tax=Erythranthe guttata TaxID=4155 RepID=A0A022QE03_ERYGU|nr:hypothetical protein MIMGU_mgv1a020965mg [Erythranthe guttata]
MDALSSSFLPKYSLSNTSFASTPKISRRTNIILKLINKTKSNNVPLLTTLFKSIDDFTCNSLDSLSPLPPSIDPHHVLSGNYAPVDHELPPTACEVVEGYSNIPRCLNGVYLRNGPNPQFLPRGPHHLLDGDGMIQMVRISDGGATFCRRYIKTYKYLTERELGYAVFPSVLSSFNGGLASMARVFVAAARVLAGEFKPAGNGFGTANVSVALIAGKLYALTESDLPYEIRVTPDGDIATLGRRDFGGGGGFINMTAHPKVDPVTGETFAFRYSGVAPFLTYFRIDSGGRKQANVAINAVKTATVVHDFAVTENYAVFNEGQMVITPAEILRGRRPVRVDGGKIPRIGVIEKYAEDDSGMVWVDAPGVNISHAVNAWEEDGGDTVVVVAANNERIEMVFERLDLVETRMEEIRVCLKTKKVQRRLLSDQFLDLAAINPAFLGRKNRYVYSPVVEMPMKIVGLVKLDVSLSSDDCVVGTRMYGPGCTGGEPFFVAKNPAAEEDDGYLVTYVYDEIVEESKFLVMDAKSPTLEIVAAVKLPGRVPDGLHGLFVTENCLSQ